MNTQSLCVIRISNVKEKQCEGMKSGMGDDVLDKGMRKDYGDKSLLGRYLNEVTVGGLGGQVILTKVAATIKALKQE